MPTEKRIRATHENFELRNARVFVARKVHECTWCGVSWVGPDGYEGHPTAIRTGEVYARISETRLAVCSAHFQYSDIVIVEKKRYLAGADVSRTSND